MTAVLFKPLFREMVERSHENGEMRVANMSQLICGGRRGAERDRAMTSADAAVRGISHRHV